MLDANDQHAPVGDGASLDLSVVAPCFDEEGVLPEFHARVTRVCEALGVEYELVLVDDGSRDGTWSIMERLLAADPHVVAIKLSRNFGHQMALHAGLTAARGRRIVAIDADLQDPPEVIPDLLAALEDGADVAYARRRVRRGETFLKRATASLFYRLLDALTDTPIPRDTGDFRAMRRRVVDVLLEMPERHRFTRGLVSWIGFRQVAVHYDRQPRAAGSSKYPFRRMLRFALDAITTFSRRPLAVATIVGFVTCGAAFLILLYALVSWIAGETVAGWTSLMAVVVLLGGVQLVVLGILGEYVGRLYEQAKGRPLYVLDRVERGGGAGPCSLSKDR